MYLFRKLLRIHFGSGGALNNMGALPLGAGHEHRPDASFRRQLLFVPFDMGFLSWQTETQARA